MDKYKETSTTFNNVASLYQDKFMDLDLYNETYDHIISSIDKPDAKLLEIGCGPGNISKYLLSKRPDYDIFGIDVAPNMIALAKLNNPSAKFAVMDTREIEKLDAKYDGIIAGFCLPYLSQTESNNLISSSYKMLNNNGLLYVSFVEGDPEKSEFKQSTGGRVFFNFHNLDKIKAQLKLAKFNEINVFKVNYKASESQFDIHTIVTAKKNN